jgi:hypothetical protein
MPLRSLLSTLPPATSPAQRTARWARLGLATAGALGAAVGMHLWTRGALVAFWIPCGLLALSALLLHHGAAGSQLVARAAWWPNLILGTVLSLCGASFEWKLGLLMSLGTGTALLAMGRLGLDEEEGSAFRPAAFRRTLLIGMTMAVADVQALCVLGAFKLEVDWGAFHGSAAERVPQAALLFASAGVIVLALSGLYRLRLWGLLLAALAAAGVAALALSGAYGLPSPFQECLVATSAIQVLLPARILAAIARGRPAAPARAPSRLAALAPAVVVALMMVASASRLALG